MGRPGQSGHAELLQEEGQLVLEILISSTRTETCRKKRNLFRTLCVSPYLYPSPQSISQTNFNSKNCFLLLFSKNKVGSILVFKYFRQSRSYSLEYQHCKLSSHLLFL